MQKNASSSSSRESSSGSGNSSSGGGSSNKKSSKKNSSSVQSSLDTNNSSGGGGGGGPGGHLRISGQSSSANTSPSSGNHSGGNSNNNPSSLLSVNGGSRLYCCSVQPPQILGPNGISNGSSGSYTDCSPEGTYDIYGSSTPTWAYQDMADRSLALGHSQGHYGGGGPIQMTLPPPTPPGLNHHSQHSGLDVTGPPAMIQSHLSLNSSSSGMKIEGACNA